MSDETTTPEITTADSSLVSRPIESAKPYDDDILESYAEEAAAETKTETPSVQKEAPEVEAKEPEKAEDSAPEPEKAPDTDPLASIEETAITRTINGKEVEFKIKDAIQAFTKQEEFNRNMDKRITHVSQREKRWQAEQANFKGVIDKILNVTQSGDFVGGVRALARLAAGSSKVDTVEFEKKYFAQLDKVREVYSKMTPEQQEAYFAKRAAAEATERAARLEDEKTTQVELSQLQEQVNRLMATYQVPDKEFWANYRAIADSQVGQGKRFATPNDIKPEDVIQFTFQVRHEEKVLQAGEKLGISDDAILDEVSRITIVRPDLSVDDIVKVIEGSGLAKTASPEAVENLNRKAGKNGSQFSQASSTKKENGKIDGLEAEDLDFLYRKQPRSYARPVR